VILRLRDQELALDGRGRSPLIMGIVNIGGESVADAARLPALADQLDFARRQLAAGADLIDVGVQSGRTDTRTIPEREELARLVPLVSELAAEGALVSVETWRPAVADRALAAGASLINDVSGLADRRLADVVAARGAGLVVMHTRARPKQERFPSYDDPMADVIELLRSRVEEAKARGVGRDRLLVDPGLDYAKTPAESVQVLRRLPELRQLGLPVLLAASRKYFIGMLTAAPPDQRLPGTLAAIGFGARHGAHVLRVHDVGPVRDFMRVQAALQSDGDPVLLGDPRDEALKWLPPQVPEG
jgi:dihydropteroate synthase